MNYTLTRITRPSIEKLVSYDLNTKVFIDFRIKEQVKHKLSSQYLLLSNKIDKLFNRIKELSKN